MAQKKDRKLCWDCQSSAIEYSTTITGCKTDKGLCRRCYERKASRGNGGCMFGRHVRPKDAKEDTTETANGIDH